MGTILGLLLGAGVFLVWWSFWGELSPRSAPLDGWTARTQDALVQAGVTGVTTGALVGAAAGLGAMVSLVAAGLTHSAVIGLCFGAMSMRAPFAVIHARARTRGNSMREVWPEAVDHLASGVRAGLSLPEALTQLGDRGPVEIRAPFAIFAADYRASGRFEESLDALKARLADPVADRIVESLRVTRDVGGSDLGRVLRTLSGFLREDARTRGELEARQSWTVNAARLAVVAPWTVLLVLSSRREAAEAYNSPAGVTVLIFGAAMTVAAYRLMIRVGRLPIENRVMR